VGVRLFERNRRKALAVPRDSNFCSRSPSNEACRMRLRPIVMTSIAFIAGSVPLLLGHGAGSEVRAATGTTVFSGMLGVTLFGLFLTPVFYVALRTWTKKEIREEWEESREGSEASHA